MMPKNSAGPAPEAAHPENGTWASPFTAVDVEAILCESGWLDAADGNVARTFTLGEGRGQAQASQEASYKADLDAWLADAAALLGPHAAGREALADLLRLVFRYDAHAILQSSESHIVLAREGARDVIRELAHLVLDGPEIDSDRLKEIVAALKEKLRFRGRELFHPIRLALAGRAGEGELDRVVLLLDRAARLAFRARVKGARERMLEFCASLE